VLLLLTLDVHCCMRHACCLCLALLEPISAAEKLRYEVHSSVIGHMHCIALLLLALVARERFQTNVA
jgi:hypothetical protein